MIEIRNIAVVMALMLAPALAAGACIGFYCVPSDGASIGGVYDPGTDTGGSYGFGWQDRPAMAGGLHPRPARRPYAERNSMDAQTQEILSDLLSEMRRSNQIRSSENSWRNIQSILGCCYGRPGEMEGFR